MKGYSVYFGLNDKRNVYESFMVDKETLRVETYAILQALHRLAPHAAGSAQQLWTVFTTSRETARQLSLSDFGDPGEKVNSNTWTWSQFEWEFPPQPSVPGPEDIEWETRQEYMDDKELLRRHYVASVDLVLQIYEVRKWLRKQRLTTVVSHVLDDEENARHAVKLAEIGLNGHISEEQVVRNEFRHEEPEIANSVSKLESKSVWIDGTLAATTESEDDAMVAGYCLYFGYFDRRNECARYLVDGVNITNATSVSIAVIIQALRAISTSNNGHKRWRIFARRHDTLVAVFELSKIWRNSGWKRADGSDVGHANLLRVARQLLDALEAEKFKIDYECVPPKSKNDDPGMLMAEFTARRAAGSVSFDLPTMTMSPLTTTSAFSSFEDTCSYLFIESTYKQTELKGRYKIRFGPNPPLAAGFLGGFADPRDQDGVTGSLHQSRERCAMYVVHKALRLIEQSIERRWVIYTNSSDAVEALNEFMVQRPDRKPPLYLESVMKQIRRLWKQGIEIEFKPSPFVNSSSEAHYEFNPQTDNEDSD